MGDVSNDRSVIHKLTLCSHDRNDLNEDTSDFSINIEQIPNARKFCLRNAFLPLSSYTFEQGDIDSTLTLVNLGTQPKGTFEHPAVEGTLFMNGFVVPIGSDYDPTQTFPLNDPDSVLVQTFSWIQIPPFTKFVIRAPLFFGETEIKWFYDVPNCDNTSNPDFLNVNMFTVMQGMNITLRFFCEGNMGPGNAYEAQIGLSNYPTFLQINDYDRFNNGANLSLPFFFSVFEHSNLDNMTFKYFEFGTATDTTPRPPVQTTSPTFIPPTGWTVIELFHNMYNTPTGTKQTVSCTQLQNSGLFASSTTSINLPDGVVYTPNTILAGLNSATVPFGLTCSLQPTGGIPVLEIQNTGPRFYADLTVYPNLKLGIYDILQTRSSVTLLVAQRPITLIRDGDIKFFSIPCTVGPFGGDEHTVRDTFNAVLSTYDITMYLGVRYLNVNILNQPSLPGSVTDGWDVVNKGVYGFRLGTDKYYTLAGCRIDTTALDPAVGNPVSYWEDKSAKFVYASDTNSYMMQQDFYYKSIPKYPLWNYQFPLDELLTTSDVQTVLNTIHVDHPTLTLTLDNSKNAILIDNNGLDWYQFYPNHKMGVYDTTTADSSVTSSGGTTEYAPHPVDLTGRNACMSIGLSFYHDGRTAQCYGGRAIHGGIPRPIRRNIVCTVYNATQTNYGQMIHYSNPSDTWLPCYYNNIQDIRIQIYNDQLLPINLHKKDVHLEIDIMADPV